MNRLLRPGSPHRYRPFVAGIGSFAVLISAGPSSAGVGVDASAFIEAVTLEGVVAHMEAFQEFADNGDGTRSAGTDGYLDSAFYISEKMINAGYEVSLQIFPFTFFEDNTPPVLEQISPNATSYPADDQDNGVFSGENSGSADVTAAIESVDLVLPPAPEANTSTSGCETEDFAGFTAGNIALIQRGTCPFADKAINAEAAGAAGVIIFNEGQEDGRTGAFSPTLGAEALGIPVVFAAFAIGDELAAAANPQVRLKVDATTEIRLTANVIADAPLGDPNVVPVVGAHLDSVEEGPGINDNGSGSGGILEIALQLAELGYLEDGEMGLRNRLRFAWWGAEELGLIGSEYYVANLSDEEIEDIALNLNFDMIGSPNYARFVYDGDGSDSEPAGPEGSAFIEWLFRDYFEENGLSSTPTQFSGRSDYGPFIAVDIPAGGLFTGAEGLKTEEEVGLYGGEAEVAYDACYHLECDTIENYNEQGLTEMADAAAYATFVFGMNRLPESMAKARSTRVVDSVVLDYQGNRLQR